MTTSLTINNIKMGGKGRSDKFPRKILQKCEGVPRLLPSIVEGKVINGKKNEALDPTGT